MVDPPPFFSERLNAKGEIMFLSHNITVEMQSFHSCDLLTKVYALSFAQICKGNLAIVDNVII